MPKKKVSHIVTNRVLEMDKRSCENLLKAILEEKKEEDMKKALVQQERLIARNKTTERHNKGLSHLAKIGVKIRDCTSELSKKNNENVVQGFSDIMDRAYSYNRSTLEKSDGFGTPLQASKAGKKTYIF